MQYTKGSAHGNAGEYFVAYKISKVLGWPCRLLDIDIGIDGQIELMTDDGFSTGRLVAIQVKTTSDAKADCCYVEEKHLLYWRSLKLPVLVILVRLHDEKMYLHRVDRFHEYERTEGERRKICFDLGQDEFSEHSATKIRMASTHRATVAVEGYLHAAEDAAKEIVEALKSAVDAPDPQSLIELMDKRFGWLENIASAKALSDETEAAQDTVVDVSRDLEWALRDLQDYMGQPGMAHYKHKTDIGRFLQEEYERRPPRS